MAPPPAAWASSPDEVEQQFYEALNEANLDKLMALWADDDDVVCVHPNGLRVVGPVALRASFEAMLAQGGLPVMPASVQRLHTLWTAVHSVTECVTPPDAPQGASHWILATNVYLKTEQGWRIVAHHASAAPMAQVVEAFERPATLH